MLDLILAGIGARGTAPRRGAANINFELIVADVIDVARGAGVYHVG